MSRRPTGRPWRPHLTVTLPPDLLAQVRERAAAEGRTMSAWVARAVEGALRSEATRAPA